MIEETTILNSCFFVRTVNHDRVKIVWSRLIPKRGKILGKSTSNDTFWQPNSDLILSLQTDILILHLLI
jgi:hypothetical protein